MTALPWPCVQVAGVRDAAEARMLRGSGVDWLGIPLRLAHHAPDLSESQAAALLRHTGLAPWAVLITYELRSGALLELMDLLGVDKVQLHAECGPALPAALKAARPELICIKSLVVAQDNLETLEAQVRSFTPWVDAFLTDTFDPATGARGATGQTHDWATSARLARLSPRPLILAGGLAPDNVGEAILRVRPAGVDAHTGLEDASGRKDPGLVRGFVAAARQAFAQMG